MIASRTHKKVPVGDNKERHMVRIDGPTVALGSIAYEHERYNLLKDLVQFPELLECGTSRFQTMKIFFDGNRWVAELEAVLDLPPKAA